MNDSDLLDPESPIYGAIHGPVGQLWLNRPDRRNALTTALWRRFVSVLERLERDKEIRVISVLSTAERAFCAGADIAELQDIMGDPASVEETRLAIREAQGRLACSPKPTIAVIAGACFGGGCGLALHADFRLAAKSARFAITPAKLGLIYPLRDTARLTSLVGPARAKLMLYSAEAINSERAYAWGLVDAVVPDADLRSEADRMLGQICSLAPQSIALMKEQFARIEAGQNDDDAWSAQAFVDRHISADVGEGVTAFLEKRSPSFED